MVSVLVFSLQQEYVNFTQNREPSELNEWWIRKDCKYCLVWGSLIIVVIATLMCVESLCFATYSAWISSLNAITSAYGALTVVSGSVLDW